MLAQVEELAANQYNCEVEVLHELKMVIGKERVRGVCLVSIKADAPGCFRLLMA